MTQFTHHFFFSLVSGPVNGKVDQLFARAIAVNKQAGPFDALFCVGSFFSPDKNEELEKYLNNASEGIVFFAF